ncbi:MAG: sigma-70 family RNA polymerase sigma factor [Blautia sp.]|nr:sigma-70 family RNA polymerase sigma factor [Blautia sp.]
MIEEQFLIRQIAAGEERAMKQVIDRYSPHVTTIAANIIRPPLTTADVEEVVSDVFLTLWKNPGTDNGNNLKAYLSAIARNKAKDKLRSFHLAVPLEDDMLDISASGPEEQVEKQQLYAAMRNAVQRLPEPDRTIVLRHYYYYQKTDVIAKQMGLNPATVRTKLARSRQKLKAWMEEYLKG